MPRRTRRVEQFAAKELQPDDPLLGIVRQILLQQEEVLRKPQRGIRGENRLHVHQRFDDVDARAAALAASLRGDGRGDLLYPLCLQKPWPSQTATLLAWIKHHQSGLYARAGTAFLCKDALTLMLTGQRSSDYSDMSGSGLLRLPQRRYDSALLDAYGLADAAPLLPPLIESDQIAGRLTREAAAVTGLSEGTPVAAGFFDVIASMLGAGASTPGQAAIVAGTWSINQVILDAPLIDDRIFHSSTWRSDRYVAIESSATSAVNLEWFVREFIGLETPDPFGQCSEAVAEALALADIDVVTAYPIRPYDTVMQAIAKKIANGQLVAEYIVAEGEHSQFEIVKHASTVGARVFCGSSGVGWAYAMECLVVTPPLRVPMLALVGNRALDDPGAFGVEHNDALFVRDLGWMLCWIDSSQEALDTTLIGYRVAEDRRVFLPLAISADGAFLTHSQALTLVPPKAKVDRFLPSYNRGDLLLHPDNPITVAPQANEDWVIEIRRQNDAAMKRATTVIEEAYADFRRVFGRGPENPWFEEYMTEDAEIILVGMGTISEPTHKRTKGQCKDTGDKTTARHINITTQEGT